MTWSSVLEKIKLFLNFAAKGNANSHWQHYKTNSHIQ